MRDRPLHDLIRHQDPVTLGPAAMASEACARMRDRRVGCVLVTDGEGRLLGIFTGRDAVCRIAAAGRDATRTPLAEVMTAGPASLPPGATALDALRLMQDGGFRHVPICREGRVAGVVSRGDFRALDHARLDEETGLWERI